MSELAAQPVLLFSWDGSEAPLRMLHLDAAPRFRIILFDYSGRCRQACLDVAGIPCDVLSQVTECKGDIYQALAAHLSAQATLPEYVGLIDDDVLLQVSDLNRLLHIARVMSLDSCSPALTHDSFYSHRWTLKRGNVLLHWVDWVEVMMPVYRGELFMAGAPHYVGNTSSFGIDNYLMPTLQKLHGWERTAIVNDILASHLRKISSTRRTFKNGRTAFEEKDLMKARCLQMLAEQRPELSSSAWKRRVFDLRQERTGWQRFAYRIGRPIRRWLELST